MRVPVAVADAPTSLRPRQSRLRRGLPYAMVGLGFVATVAWNGYLVYLLLALVRKAL
jgi:hypothetical protein